MSISLFTPYLTPTEIVQLEETAKKIGVPTPWLMGTIYFETARTFKPTITNKIGSVGLIQFTRDRAGVQYKTISGKKYLLSDIKAMTFGQQLDLVELYYRPFKGKLNSFLDVYLATFFPAAIGKSFDFVLETKSLSRALIATQNPVFDKNKDKKITLSEIRSFFSNYFGKQNFDLIESKQLSLVWLLAIPFFF